jgi:hypothetical protein
MQFNTQFITIDEIIAEHQHNKIIRATLTVCSDYVPPMLEVNVKNPYLTTLRYVGFNGKWALQSYEMDSSHSILPDDDNRIAAVFAIAQRITIEV